VEVNAWILFLYLKPGEAQLLSGTRRVWGCGLYVVGSDVFGRGTSFMFMLFIYSLFTLLSAFPPEVVF